MSRPPDRLLPGTISNRMSEFPTLLPSPRSQGIVHLLLCASEEVPLVGSCSSMSTLATDYLLAGYGGLVLASEPTTVDLWGRYAAESGRRGDLVVVKPAVDFKFDFVEYALGWTEQGARQADCLAPFLTRVAEIAVAAWGGAADPRSRSRATREMLWNAITILGLSGQRVTLTLLARFIRDAPTSAEELEDEVWRRTSICVLAIDEAACSEKSPGQASDFAVAARYWQSDWPSMGEVAASLAASFTTAADILLHGLARELLVEDSTILPDWTYRRGTVIVLDLPSREGRVVQAIWAHMWELAILRRDPRQHPRPVFLFMEDQHRYFAIQGNLLESTAFQCGKARRTIGDLRSLRA